MENVVKDVFDTITANTITVKEIKAEKVEIVDIKGETVAILGNIKMEKSLDISTSNEEGKPMALGISTFNEEGKPMVLGISSNIEEGEGLGIYNKNKQLMAILGRNKEGKGTLKIFNEEGNVIVSI